jgi:protoporphyrinogen oxidase
MGIKEKRVVVIGAGPSGLTAAYELWGHGVRADVYEKDDIVGGLARTARHDGYRFDMGGHRFFTKAAEVQRIWHEVLGPDFLKRPRLSRIYYDGRFFQYPLKPWNALSRLGFYQSFRVGLSYIKWQVMPHQVERTFEQWVTNRFGKRLFLIFFRDYTEKVWGVPCTELKAEWAAQRIKDLSLRTAVISMIIKPRQTIKTLIEEFEYPRLGPGMMWEKMAELVEDAGGKVSLESPLLRFKREGMRFTSAVVGDGDGEREVPGSDFISSMPITDLVKRLDPPAPPEVIAAANRLSYRSFLTVCLVTNDADLFPDNWIYIHDPNVRVGRIQNYKNWSPDMVPDLAKSGIGMEYFCNEGDELWNTPDAELVEMATRELESIGLARSESVESGCVFRMAKAYPVYDSEYAEHLDCIRNYVSGFENLQTIGRNGLHRYDNQDHAMMTGLLAARNLALGESNDVWAVNTDAEYHEEEVLDAPVADEVQATQ